MADLLPLVQTYIGPISKPKHLNYYSALGLDALTEDRGAIALAVEAAIDKLKKADRTKDPKGFEEVVKIVRHARITLLDGEKKSAYDVQLKALLRKVAPSVLGEDSQWLTESARLKELLPVGDPSAPFSLTDFLKSRPEDIAYETVAERQAALRPLLEYDAAETSRSSPVETSRGQFPSVIESNRIPSTVGVSTASRRSSAKALQEELRRSRKQKNLIAGGVAIGAACLLVGVGLWMFLSSQAEQQAYIQQKAANQTVQQSVKSPTSIAEGNPSEGMKSATKPNEKPKKTRMNLGIVPDSNSTSMNDAAPMQLPSIGGGDETATEPEETKPAMNPAATAPEVPMNEPASVPIMEEDNVENWTKSMRSALDSVKKRNFTQFEADIEKAFAATTDPEKTKQTERLNLIGQLVPMSEKAFRDGYAGLRSTNTISLGGTNKANIVEATPDLLVARVKGKNERLPKDQLPMDWVLAIANLELSDTAIDDAVRGTLLQWETRATAESRANAKNYFEKATSKDKKFSNLETVFDGDYK